MSNKPTIVWDFNGTLLYDIEACVNALNTILKAHHIAPIDEAYYRAHFGFPAANFYLHLGLKITSAYDWEALAENFHMRYIFSKTLRLQPGAMQCVQHLHQQGFQQGVLSALEQDLLELQMQQFGLARPMQFICGSRNYDGATKLDTARSLAFKGPVLMIGDTLHDAEVAAAMGWHCILCSAGHQTEARLRAAGVPLIPSLHALPEAMKQLGFFA
jgi:phosphoglycolate phosphatase